MAVYTKISADQLSDFLENYNIGKAISLDEIAQGVENSNFRLTTQNGTYILTLYEGRVNPADLPFFFDLLSHLSNNNINCPTPIYDKQNNAWRILLQKPAAITRFLQGQSVTEPTIEQCGRLGAVLANLHKIGKIFNGQRQNNFALAKWFNIAASLYEKPISSDLINMIKTELNFLQSNWPTDLPCGIIHADLFPDNVFFIDNNISGLIDFYFSCYDILSYDLAICLNAWCFEANGQFNYQKAKAMYDNYIKTRKLQQNEIDKLPILCRGGAMRFLLTRLYDWHNQQAGALVALLNPDEYLTKLRFHQNIISAKDYGFI